MLSVDAYYEMCGICSQASEQLAEGKRLPDTSKIRIEMLLYVNQLKRVQEVMSGSKEVRVNDQDLLTVCRDMPILERLYGELTYTKHCTKQLDIILNAMAHGGLYVPKAEAFCREAAECYSEAASFLNRE